MNDIDFEEKLLLHSLHHQHLQPLNLPGPNDNISTDYQYRQQRHYIDDLKHNNRYNEKTQNESRMEPTPIDYESNHHRLASTVSMSTEEDILDTIELNFEEEHHDNNDDTVTDMEPLDTATTVSSKSTIPGNNKSCMVTPDLPRNITMEPEQLLATKPKKKRKPSPTRSSKNDASKVNHKPVRVEKPTKEDILCGQSRVCASHPGNRHFQQVLADFAHRYDIATSKQEKMQMTKAIVSIIHDSGGRFLKFKDGMWQEISTVAARDKVSHALRTKVSSWKRQHAQLLQRERDLFAPPRRTSLSRKSRKRGLPTSTRTNNNDDEAAPISFDADDVQSSSKVSELLHSQQALFAQLNSVPSTPMPSPRSSRSNHHVRHSFGGRSSTTSHHHDHHHHHGYSHHHSRRSSSSF